MSATAIVWLVIVIAWIAVFGLVGMQALRALREVNRLRSRAAAYAGLPLVTALERAAGNAQRLERSAALIEPLLERAQEAIAEIRRGPFPPELVVALVRVRNELAAFRNLRAR